MKAVATCVRSGMPKTGEASSALYHQHYPAFGLDESVGVSHYDSIDLRRCHRLSVLPDVESPSVYCVGNLLRPQPAAALGKDKKYGFLNFHLFRYNVFQACRYSST